MITFSLTAVAPSSSAQLSPPTWTWPLQPWRRSYSSRKISAEKPSMKSNLNYFLNQSSWGDTELVFLKSSVFKITVFSEVIPISTKNDSQKIWNMKQFCMYNFRTIFFRSKFSMKELATIKGLENVVSESKEFAKQPSGKLVLRLFDQYRFKKITSDN